MEMTGWLSGQVFLQTVDDKEVNAVSEFLNARGLAFQVLTLTERMVTDAGAPGSTVSNDRFSVAIQLAGFPQVVGPVLNDLIQRTHGGGWDPASGTPQ
ncbi:MAG: hypothetical protein QOK11_3194 [Pseudonocardiales bacterium]|jgi:hypothetical protein|nr:hypothetical protein [Pseudonocardiales bacterium]MDT4943344.1 hypothetical protein [Pseudonocardiales bacterium]